MSLPLLRITIVAEALSWDHFLGHVVTGESIKPSPAKTATIQAFPLPTTLKQIQVWLGLCNWYGHFIKGFAALAAPWVELTKKE